MATSGVVYPALLPKGWLTVLGLEPKILIGVLVSVGCSASRPPPKSSAEQMAELGERQSLGQGDYTTCDLTHQDLLADEAKCSEGQTLECARAATAYWRGCGGKKDDIKAEALYKAACDGGSSVSCHMEVTLMFERDPGTEPQVIEILEQQCSRRNPEECGDLGAVLALPPARDIRRGFALLKGACSNDLPVYCEKMGVVVAENHLSSEYDETRRQLNLICNNGHRDTCFVLAKSYERGDLGVKNTELAAQIYGKACAAGSSESCQSLGYMLISGDGVDKDSVRGMQFFYQACGAGFGPACESMGDGVQNGWGGPPNPEKALEFYGYACAIGCASACAKARPRKP